MEKKLNFEEIGLDLICELFFKEGDPMWSDVFGWVEYIEVHNRNGNQPMIKVRTGVGECRNITPRGRIGYNYDSFGSCILWPDNNKTWDVYVEKYKTFTDPQPINLEVVDAVNPKVTISKYLFLGLDKKVSESKTPLFTFDGKKIIIEL